VGAHHRHGAATAHERERSVQRAGRAGRLDHHVRTKTVGRGRHGVRGAGGLDHLGPIGGRQLAPLGDAVDRDDLARRPRRHHRGHQPHAAEAQDHHHVADRDAAAADGAVTGREHVRKEHRVLVRDRIGDRPQAAVGERDPHQVGLATLEPRIDARVAE
jgi:hypothetical protein